MTLNTSLTRLRDLNIERFSAADLKFISLVFNLKSDSGYLNSRNMYLDLCLGIYMYMLCLMGVGWFF